MIDVLHQPLVTAYLRELDTALASLPPATAAELAEQIRAHLLEALPPDADEGAVAAVLAALGPARLVAAAAADPVSDPLPAAPARRDPILRRLAAWARRLTTASRLTIAGIAVAIGLPAGALIYWQAQSGLQFMTTYAWWSPVDSAHDVVTNAAGVSQDTVPIRPGKMQGFVLTIYNPSDMTQVILSSADQVSPGAPGAPQIAVSTTGTIHQSGEPHWVSYRLDGGPIPPHSYRWVRVLWRSYHCYLNAVGGGQGTNQMLLRVRVGWITRTEDIQLPTQFTLEATAATVKSDHCGANPVPRP
jgi:hypothetical protein